MSEYWVSKKKYFCKYCEIYIADDAPSRQQHENGLRHKGSVERFIRGIYKAGEKQKKDREEEKREMARVEQAANSAFAADISAGRAKPQAAPVASSSTSRKPAPQPSNPYANYSTAESLGYTDPDAERIEAELKIRQSQGLVGDWQVVESTPPPVDTSAPTDNPQDTMIKREAEAPPEDDSRHFKLRKKTAVGLNEMYDPGVIPIKLKKKKEETPPPPDPPSTSTSFETAALTQPTDRPKWTKIQLFRPQEDVKEDPEPVTVFDKSSASHLPNENTPIKEEIKGPTLPYVKTEEPAPDHPIEPTGSLFKKRKNIGGASRGRR